MPESEDLAKKVKEAMEAVEKYTAELKDTLPKDIYYSVNSEDDPLVLAKLLKNFKDFVSVWGEVLFLKRLKNRAANIADIVRRVSGVFALTSTFA